MNAKTELMEIVKEVGKTLEDIIYGKIVIINISPDKNNLYSKIESRIVWEPGESIDKLDTNYDNGYGGQELYGTLVFGDGSWLERFEYDGAEWWNYKQTPKMSDINKDLEWILD